VRQQLTQRTQRRFHLAHLAIWGLILILALAACNGGDDGGDGDSNAPRETATPDADATEPAVPLGDEDISGFPMERVIRALDGLTLVSSSTALQEWMLYVMFVVRNDGPETVQRVKALLSFLDSGNLRLRDENLPSSAVNIAPGQTIALLGSYLVPEDYDGLAARVVVEPGILESYKSYTDFAVTAQFSPETGTVTGTAENSGSIPLVQPVGHFVLWDSAGNVIAVVPAQIEGLDNNGMWQPGVTLTLSGQVFAYAGDDPSRVAQTELLMSGYELIPQPTPTPAPTREPTQQP
jgi:hypothetical protein